MLLVTGGCGFIGSAFIHRWLATSAEPVVNLDLLTYAGHESNLEAFRGDARLHTVHGDIADASLTASLLARWRPRAVVHFAAETHVDVSIGAPLQSGETNALGTLRLLEAVRAHWSALPGPESRAFRFLHVSTDEVYGSLEPGDPPFREDDPYRPNSPYSASKAASDHFVRAYGQTYGLPVLLTHCSNNYGPRQYPEKLIPLMLRQAVRGLPLPLYGDGLQVRDWLHVDDHCEALLTVLARGRPGRTYNIGGDAQHTNLWMVRQLCALLDELQPRAAGPHAQLITPVTDRPGHDRRYAVDNTRITSELGWAPTTPLAQGLANTVRWYLDHPDWVEHVLADAARRRARPQP
jgi:dTDP-glucose 4,6-dehydratase